MFKKKDRVSKENYAFVSTRLPRETKVLFTRLCAKSGVTTSEALREMIDASLDGRLEIKE